MSGEEKTARHERAAVAYAHRLVTNAGLMWREITGQDIGIDAIIELPYADSKEHGARGFVLVQIKARSGAVRRNRVSAVYKTRHDVYWLTQRLPVLICVVEPADSGVYTTAASGRWIDYKSLMPAEFSISKSKDEKRWTVRVEQRSPHVWPPPGSTFNSWASEAASFWRWIQDVVIRPAEAIVGALLEAAEDLLGSGKPKQAQVYLQRQMPVWEEVLLKEESRQSLDMAIARTYRRLGAVAEQTRKMATYRRKGARLPEFMQFELALTHWTRASMRGFPNSRPAGWRKALKALGTARYTNPVDVDDLKRGLIRSDALVNIKSTLSCLTRRDVDAPGDVDCRQLQGAIDAWEKSKEAKLERRFQAHLLNALRALCRGRLARGELSHAEGILKTLNQTMRREPDREVLALTDLLLLTAWISLETRETERASATLECTRYLLNAMHDPLLEWFHQAIEARARGLSGQRHSAALRPYTGLQASASAATTGHRLKPKR